MRRTAEIEVGLDGAKAVDDVPPGPSGQRCPIEIARQPAAEVAAVDGTGTADGRAADDRRLANGPIGQPGLVMLHQRAVGPDR